MLKGFAKAVVVVSLTFAVAGCEQAIQKVTGQAIKGKMLELCGEADKVCLAAVEQQYDACEAKYRQRFTDYMNARTSEEDAIIDDYMTKMYSCVVDEDGDPYFVYAPD